MRELHELQLGNARLLQIQDTNRKLKLAMEILYDLAARFHPDRHAMSEQDYQHELDAARDMMNRAMDALAPKEPANGK